MNSVEQPLGLMSLNSSVTENSLALGNGVKGEPITDDKALENKEFSSVFSEQQVEQEHSENLAWQPSINVDTQGAVGDSGVILVPQVLIQEGSVLPAGGISLPPDQPLPSGDKITEELNVEFNQAAANSHEASVVVGKQAKVVSSTGVLPVADEVEVNRSIAYTDRPLSRSAPIASQPSVLVDDSVTDSSSVMVSKKDIGFATSLASNSLEKGQFEIPASANTQVEIAASKESTVLASTKASLSELNTSFPFKQQILANSVVSDVIGEVNTSGLDASGTKPLVAATPVGLNQTYRQPALVESFQSSVPIGVGKPGWGDAVMDKVMWMSSQQIGRAEIALDPPELGPLQIRITTSQDQTSIVFSSSQGAVRDALDQGLPKLREMMEEQGLSLGDVDVSHQSASQRENTEAEDSDSTRANDSVAQSQMSEGDTVKRTQSGTLSLVDQYV